MTNDSTKAITVEKKSDNEYWVNMYDLNENELTVRDKIGGQESDYIKVKQVE